MKTNIEVATPCVKISESNPVSVENPKINASQTIEIAYISIEDTIFLDILDLYRNVMPKNANKFTAMFIIKFSNIRNEAVLTAKYKL